MSIIVAVLAVFWVVGTIDRKDEPTVNNKTVKKENVEKPAEKVQENIFEFDSSISTEENIKNFLNSNLKDKKNLEVSYKDSEGASPLLIKVQGSSMFFETTWFNIAQDTIRNMPEELKSKISEYKFEIHADFMDKFGNQVIEKAMTFTINSETASKINWTMMYPEKLKPLLSDVWENPAIKK